MQFLNPDGRDNAGPQRCVRTHPHTNIFVYLFWICNHDNISFRDKKRFIILPLAAQSRKHKHTQIHTEIHKYRADTITDKNTKHLSLCTNYRLWAVNTNHKREQIQKCEATFIHSYTFLPQ